MVEAGCLVRVGSNMRARGGFSEKCFVFEEDTTEGILIEFVGGELFFRGEE